MSGHYITTTELSTFIIFRWSSSVLCLEPPKSSSSYRSGVPWASTIQSNPFSQTIFHISSVCVGRLPTQPCITFMHVATLNSYFIRPAHAYTDVYDDACIPTHVIVHPPRTSTSFETEKPSYCACANELIVCACASSCPRMRTKFAN